MKLNPYHQKNFKEDISFCDFLWFFFNTSVSENIILIELKKIVFPPAMQSGILEFYCRYVDDTLEFVKKDQIDKILNAFN